MQIPQRGRFLPSDAFWKYPFSSFTSGHLPTSTWVVRNMFYYGSMYFFPTCVGSWIVPGFLLLSYVCVCACALILEKRIPHEWMLKFAIVVRIKSKVFWTPSKALTGIQGPGGAFLMGTRWPSTRLRTSRKRPAPRGGAGKWRGQGAHPQPRSRKVHVQPRWPSAGTDKGRGRGGAQVAGGRHGAGILQVANYAWQALITQSHSCTVSRRRPDLEYLSLSRWSWAPP